MAVTQRLQLLIHRLTQRGVSLEHMPGLMRHVFWIIGDGGLFTSQTVNVWLERLGWAPNLLDETTFQIIVSLLESEWGYSVRHYGIGQWRELRRHIGEVKGFTCQG